MGKIKIELGDRSYEIAVGSGYLGSELPRQVKRCSRPGGRIFVIFDAQVFALYGSHVLESVRKPGLTAIELLVPPGERSKSSRTVGDIYSFLFAQQVARDDFVLAVGGGVVTDLAGFVAATTLRGIGWGAVPTTLLGMVDAAIGGKTGINHKLGKNLIGAFWQPSFVTCDLTFLQTLPGRELLAGYGEIAKYAGLAGGEFLTRFGEALGHGELLDRRLGPLVELSAGYKADIVSRDEREGKLRMLLNLGHTFGHAIEQTLGYGRLRHGEAVLLGLDAAIELSVRLKPARRGRLEGFQEHVRRLIGRLPRRELQPERIEVAMLLDKKRSGRKQTFVLLDAPGKPFIATDVPVKAMRDAIAAMASHYGSRGGSHVKNSRG